MSSSAEFSQAVQEAIRRGQLASTGRRRRKRTHPDQRPKPRRGADLQTNRAYDVTGVRRDEIDTYFLARALLRIAQDTYREAKQQPTADG